MGVSDKYRHRDYIGHPFLLSIHTRNPCTRPFAHVGADPLQTFATPRGELTSLHALALAGGYWGGPDFIAITTILFVHVTPKKIIKRKLSGMTPSSRSGTLKLASVSPAHGMRSRKGKTEEGKLQDYLECALMQRDLTGNTPLHLAIVMVLVWA